MGPRFPLRQMSPWTNNYPVSFVSAPSVIQPVGQQLFAGTNQQFGQLFGGTSQQFGQLFGQNQQFGQQLFGPLPGGNNQGQLTLQSSQPVINTMNTMSMVSGDSGLYPATPVENQATRDARTLLLSTPSYPQVIDINQMTPQQVSAIQILHAAHITQELIRLHNEWHQSNSIGGTRGRGSGTIMLGMHSVMLRNFERFVDPSGRWKLPPWAMSADGRLLPLPAQVTVDPKFASLGSPGTNSPQYTEPAVFTATQGPESLVEFRTLDDVGRAYGLQNHNGPHDAMRGDIMPNSAVSPVHLAFYLWHARIQREVETKWLTSANGQQWSRANPTHPFLTGQGMSSFDSPVSYVNHGECGNVPTPGSRPICAWLERMQQLVNPTMT